MTFCDAIIVNIIFLLFPIFVYLIYLAYTNNINKKLNEIIFDFLIFSSLYLLIRYRIYYTNTTFLLLVNIPLIISFSRKRYVLSGILSIIIVVYYNKFYDFSLLFVLLEYLFYYISFYLLRNKLKTSESIINSFTFIKGIILSIEIFYILPSEQSFLTVVINLFILLVIFYMLCCIAIKLMEKGERIISLNNVMKELEKEKTLRNALFKITHEIKNPIAVCRGYVDMMDYENIDKIKKYNTIIKNELNRTLVIMDDFLDYTKIKVELDIMDINMLMNDTLLSMNALFKEHNIKVISSVSSDELFINGDYNRLKQVFINIFKNSIEAMTDENGVIKVSVKNKSKDVIITIEDNGEGMDEETLSKIGEMFFTTKNNGTGLGLSLSYEIINLHNGHIKYSSEKGKGTKITIDLHKIK